MTGREGSDHLLGGNGNDNLSGDGNADPSPDVIDGGPGYDTTDADWEGEDDPPVAVTLAGGADDGRSGEADDVRGVEQVITHQGSTLIGTAASEHLEAFQTDASSKLVGNAGDDTLRGSDGADSVDGGPGNDDIDAGFGDDVIVGGPGRDRISGDRHNGECGYLWCKYPWGNDTIYARDGEVDSDRLRGRHRHGLRRRDRRRVGRLRARRAHRHPHRLRLGRPPGRGVDGVGPARAARARGCASSPRPPDG